MKRLIPSHLYGDHAAQVATFVKSMPNGCWHYTGYIAPTGYGQVGRNIPAHRVAWEVANGRPATKGMHVDHLCHNADPVCNDDNDCLHRRCINPAHLELVTPRVNLIRGKGFAGVNAATTHCPEGHEYTEDNSYIRPDRFGRICRACRYEHNKGRGHTLVNADSPVIRAWAVAEGLRIADRGVIPRTIREAYRRAAA